ncbi:hypothetical protein [Teredinibacter turnerae]|uniref:hypothetical protein n=1 Tax=Teredinibacter turnerae TaxID=2426 RepID=UPI000422D26E|nr:hypothetical protein [Teredinibacter turnerae]
MKTIRPNRRALLAGCAFAGVALAPLAVAQDDAELNDLELGDDAELYLGESLSLGEEFTLDPDGDQVSSAAPQSKQLLGGNRKFIYQHDLAYIFTDPEEVGSNRSSLRFQWNRFIGNHLYLNVDVKPIVYLPGDDALEVDQDVDGELKTKELYASFTQGTTSVTFGRKIVVWGEAEASPVTDIISPQNIQDLVFTSLDESRLSQTMLVVDQYVGKHQWSLIANPDIKFDEQPAVATNDLPAEEDDKDVELGLRWKAAIGRADLSLMYADVLDNGAVTRYNARTGEEETNYYAAYSMFGAAANINLGNISLKIEAAFNNKRAQGIDGTAASLAEYDLGYAESDEVLFAVNSTYQENGLREWNYGVLHTEYLDYTEHFELKERRLDEFYFGVSNRFYHELVEVYLEYQYEITLESSIAHVMASYRATDNLTLQVDVFNLDNISGQFDQGSTIARIIYNF